jgi:hypothetical protein
MGIQNRFFDAGNKQTMKHNIIYIISNDNTKEYFIAKDKQILPDDWQYQIFFLDVFSQRGITLADIIDKCYTGYRVHVPICFE